MSSEASPVAVTGAFSYTGAAIADELSRRGRRLRTLTGHPGRAPDHSRVDVRPLNFGDPAELQRSLTGVEVLYNTYWVRFPHGETTFEAAVENSAVLFAAAAAAGVSRVVHVSITNPDPGSPYPYFRGKALVEDALRATGLPYAIARPAFLFGRDGVLINNVAWMLRHLPVVPVGDDGAYQVRGIHVDDLAALCADLGDARDDATVDAVGPQRLSFRCLVERVRDAVAPRTAVVSVPGWALPPMTRVLGSVLGDRLLTADEYHAMAQGLADSLAPDTGRIRFTDWLASSAEHLGRRYINDTRRHFGRDAPSRRREPLGPLGTRPRSSA